MKTIETIVDVANDLDWSVYIDKDCNEIEFSKYSPAGEDFSFVVSYNNDIVKSVKEYYEEFDPDEHATMWIEARGKVSGVPNSIRELIDDAEAIKEMIFELYTHLSSDNKI